MDRLIHVTCIKNPFDPLESREMRSFPSGRTLPEYVREFWPLAPPEGLDVAVSINGRLISTEEQADYRPSPGDIVVFCAVVRDGSDGKSTLATVAMLALVIAAPQIGAWAAAKMGFAVSTQAFSAYSIAKAAVAAGVMLAGGMLVSALLPATIPTVESPGTSSPTYSWDASQANASTEGVALPVPYGTFRVKPPLIGAYVETVGQKQYLNLLYAVAGCQVDSITDVEINQQPVSYYSGVHTDNRLGRVNQAVISYFGDTRVDVAVGAKLSTDWTTRTTQGDALQGFGVGLYCPALFYANDDGGLDSQTLKVQVEYRPTGSSTWTRLKPVNSTAVTISAGRWSGGFWNHGYTDDFPRNAWVELAEGGDDPDEHVEGEAYIPSAQQWVASLGHIIYQWRWMETSSTTYAPGEYKYDYVQVSGASQSALHWTFHRDQLAAGQYDIRVRLAETPPSGTRYQNSMYWEFTEEVIYDDFAYPGTALLAVRALADDQLSSGLPTVTCLVTRSTVPVLVGSAYVNKPATNPAWVCYDILHNEQYGGGVSADRIRYADFADWADYCSEQGFTVNGYFDVGQSLQAALNSASVQGRATVFQAGSRFTCLIERPWPASAPADKFLFTMGNIARESFCEEWLDVTNRANIVEVVYYDRDNNYTRTSIEVPAPDYDETDREINRQSVSLPCCDNLTEATRYGRSLMLQNRYLTLTGSWMAGVDSLGCLPGDVVDVAHDVPQWGFSGRLIAATVSGVTLDRIVALDAGVQYALEVKHADDSRESVYIQPVGTPTETHTLSIIGAWAHGVPAADDLYSFGTIDRIVKSFRIIKIGRPTDMKAKIQAIEYVPEIYADTYDMEIPDSASMLAGVMSLTAAESWVRRSDGSGQSVLDLSWRGAALRYQIFLRLQGASWAKVSETQQSSYRIIDALTIGATYDVAVSATSKPDEGLMRSVTIMGKLLPPSTVTGFRCWPSGGAIMCTWTHIGDADLWGYEIRQGESWDTGQTVVDGVQENRASWNPPLDGTYKLWIKAMDASGVYSTSAASAQVTVDVETEINIVLDTEEIPDEAASATLANMIYLSTAERVCWVPGMLDTDFESDDVDTDISAYAGDSAAGSYTSQVYDLGQVVSFALRMAAEYTSTARDVTDITYPNRTDRSYPTDTDTAVTSLSTLTLEYRYSDDDVTWSDWETWASPVQLTTRYYQVRALTVVDAADTYLAITAIRHIADVPDQSASALNQAVAAGGTTVTLSSLGLTILSVYEVGVTVLGTSALFPVVNKSSNQFTINLFDNTGTSQAGNVDISVRGY